MIKINIFVPKGDSKELQNRACDDFKIIEKYAMNRFNQHFFRIETTEEEYLFLLLKYGNSEVWKGDVWKDTARDDSQ